MIYISSNTDNQVIDTFDIGGTQSASYKVQYYSNSVISHSYLTLVTDGIEIYENQEALVSTNTLPLEFTTNIDRANNYIGQIKVIPSSNNMTFNIEKSIVEANLYAEHTNSGRLILNEEGFGIDFQSTSNNVTIRQSNNNFYGNPDIFLSIDELGPISTKEELASSTWLSYNSSEYTIEGNNTIITSSGQKDNFCYQEIDVIPGKCYYIQFDGYMIESEDQEVKENSLYQTGQCFVRISESLEGYELFNDIITVGPVISSRVFTVNSNKIYLKAGYGKRSSKLIISNLTLKEAVPFHTYEQEQGTIYLKWDSVANNSSILNFSNLKYISINSTNEVIIRNGSNTQLLGTQSSNNKITISYNSNTITYKLNSDPITEYQINNSSGISKLILNENVKLFSYIPIKLSNNDLLSLFSG